MSFTLDIKNFVEKAKKNPETVARSVSFKLFSAIPTESTKKGMSSATISMTV